MRAVIALAVAGTLFLAGSPAPAQMPDGRASRAAMQKLDFMVGRWKGEAWMVRGTERVHTTMTEVVERKLGGVTFLVEGLGAIPGEAGAAPRITAKIGNGEWHEIGESRDGTTWMQIMELKLKKEP